MGWKVIMLLIISALIAYSVNTYYFEKTLQQKVLLEPKEKAIGTAPLYNNSGENNITVGYRAMYTLTPSDDNIIVGGCQIKESLSEIEKEKIDEP